MMLASYSVVQRYYSNQFARFMTPDRNKIEQPGCDSNKYARLMGPVQSYWHVA
jgi:hypothetical protein